MNSRFYKDLKELAQNPKIPVERESCYPAPGPEIHDNLEFCTDFVK